MTARAPKAKTPRADTQTIRLTREEMAEAEIVRVAIGEVFATGVVRACLRVARLAAENADKHGDARDLIRVLAREARAIRDAAEKPAPAPTKRSRKSKKN